MVEQGLADLCRDDPGRELTFIVNSTVRALTEIWAGDRTPQEVLESDELEIEGGAQESRNLWRWLGTSTFAPTRVSAQQSMRPLYGNANL